MFKETATEKLIEYIQALPNSEQKLIAERISKNKTVIKKKSTTGKKPKLSLLKGKMTKTASSRIDNQIKSLRNEWQRDI
jgi:hypothetical protein